MKNLDCHWHQHHIYICVQQSGQMLAVSNFIDRLIMTCLWNVMDVLVYKKYMAIAYEVNVVVDYTLLHICTNVTFLCLYRMRAVWLIFTIFSHLSSDICKWHDHLVTVLMLVTSYIILHIWPSKICHICTMCWAYLLLAQHNASFYKLF